MILRSIQVYGRVQNVGYRKWAVKKAAELGLAGWVKNIKDGTVQIIAYGPDDKVDAFTQECHIGSSPRAQVDGLNIKDMDTDYNGNPVFEDHIGETEFPDAPPYYPPKEAEIPSLDLQ